MSGRTVFSPYSLPGWACAHTDEVVSTMLSLRPMAEAERPEGEFLLLTTDYQSAGRGRPGRHWEAERGQNLLFSLLFHPDFLPANRQFRLSQILALAVAEALDAYVGEVTVKWPNDVYVADRKICGMLLEHTLSGQTIASTLAGVGLNVNQEQFFSSAPNPVSLRQLLGRELPLDALLRDLLHRFSTRYEALRQGGAQIHTDYLEKLYRREGLHPYCDSEGGFRAEIVGISPLGLITLRDEGGQERVYGFGEVNHVI